jgi:hypothetical protein
MEDAGAYTPMIVYEPGPATLTKQNIGTRYVALLIRTLVDLRDPKDLDQVASGRTFAD